MKLLVTGGNGFIGSQVCRAAVEAGHDVVGLGRSGRPKGAAAWMDRVTWAAADVLEPDAWRHHLVGCDAVVHCVGIVVERPERGVTFARINGDAAIVAVDEAAAAGVGAFVYLSAPAKPPLVGEGYIVHKRRAEEAVLAAPLRGVVFRSGFVYGPGRLVSYPAALAVRLGLLVPGLRRAVAQNRALRVDVVARAALGAATDGSTRGILGVDAIEAAGSGDGYIRHY